MSSMTTRTTPRRPSSGPGPIHPAVLVTGGSRGIGRAICMAFAEAGWQIGVHYRERLGEADRTAAAIKEAGGEGFLLQADLCDAGAVDAMIGAFLSRCGRMDVLVCNAGVNIDGLLLRVAPDRWQRVVQTNLTGTFHCLRAAGPILLRQGDGSVVIVSSFAAHRGRPGQSAYAASKAGLLGLMKTAAREWGPSRIRVNAVFPGWHRTEMAGPAMPADTDLDDHVLKRTADLKEVARTVLHLAQLTQVSGQVWNLDSRIL